MDAASILVVVLTAGAVALLIWFEFNSRRNGSRNKTSVPTQVNSDSLQKQKPTSGSGKPNAA
jgi:hypothetical protein